MLFISNFEDLKKHSPSLSISSLFITIIDIFHMLPKNILDNNNKKYNSQSIL